MQRLSVLKGPGIFGEWLAGVLGVSVRVSEDETGRWVVVRI